MINTKELKKLLIDKDLGIKDVALCIGKSYSTALLKINGEVPITLSEADKVQTLLGIRDCDFGFYFMSHSREVRE